VPTRPFTSSRYEVASRLEPGHAILHGPPADDAGGADRGEAEHDPSSDRLAALVG